jgi:hypothetical protein
VRKKSSTTTILLKINPIRLSGLKLILEAGQEAQLHEVDFEETIWDDLKKEGFEDANPLEFNLYYSGLAQ